MLYIGIYRSLVSAIRAVEPIITSVGALANNSILPIVTMVAVGTVVSITFTYAIKECIIDKVSSIAKAGGLETTSDNTVYILTEEGEPDNVRYVGRTNNVVNRSNAHSNNPLKRTDNVPWHFYSIFTGLDIQGARIYEQALISTYIADELKKNKAEGLGGNRINSINPEKFLDKDFLKEYDSAIKKFSELEFSFGESELLCLLEGNI